MPSKDCELFSFDREASRAGTGPFAGVDEVGRGPVAGPVVAAAVIFRERISLLGLDDSKKLPAKTREILYQRIIAHAWVGIGRVSETIIDQVNIYQATRLAMRQAVLALPKTPELLLIDGKIQLDLPLPQKGIVAGDSKSAVIAAASIVAKVTRDAWMEKLDQRYPHYGFACHKGYFTRLHQEALRKHGACEVHRKSFMPIAELQEGARL
jgi:ribonuclease HII